MPKYFDGRRSLPYTKVAVPMDAICAEWIDETINEYGNISLAVQFDGLSAESLGYIFNIESGDDGLTLRDIKGVIYFRGLSVADTASYIKHASGIEYSDAVQAEFARVRDEIGLDQ